MIDIVVLTAGLTGLAACIWGILGARGDEERALDAGRARLSEMKRHPRAK